MRFASSNFTPLLLHTAMEPGDSVVLPGQAIDDCRRMGFRGCGLVGRTQLLAMREALHHMGGLGSRRQWNFKVVPGIELTVQVKQQSINCGLLARDQAGWEFILECLTRLPGTSDLVHLDLDDLVACKGHVILLVRPEGAALQRPVLKAVAKAMQVKVTIMVKKGKKELKKQVPTCYLALPGRNRAHEELGMNSGVQPLAAPDIYCTRLGHETLLEDWRAMHPLKERNPHRCLTMNSRDAVVRRFPNGRKLLSRTADVLDAIEDYDFFIPAESDDWAIQRLVNLAHSGLKTIGLVAAPIQTYQKRLQEELDEIISAGMERQFVAAATICQKMRSAGVPWAPYQGHLATSLVARVLSLTLIDPIRDGLVFRNFLQPDMVRRPSIHLTFGAGAQKVIEAHLAQDYLCLDRPLQVAHLDTETCAEQVGDHFNLDEAKRNALLKAMQKVRSTGGPGLAMFDAPIPKAPGIRRAIAITPILSMLPWEIRPHPIDLLVNPWRPTSRGYRLAPVSHEDASAFGYLPITLTIDPAQDNLGQFRLALTDQQQETVLEAIQTRSEPKALELAIEMWMRDKRLFLTGQLEKELMLGPGRPKTFDDLVALHGFLQDADIDRGALLAYFKLPRRDSGYWYSKHPVLQPIMAGTRGQILWGEQCFHLMVHGLRLEEDEAHGYLDKAKTDRQGATQRWEEEASRIKKKAHVPRNPLIPKGTILNVALAKSSQRRKMYKRTVTGKHPPMSVKEVEALHVAVGDALGRTRSKAEAIAAAMRGYEQGLLELVKKK
jgi:hypothetical protein